MNLLKIAWSNINDKRLSSFLSVMLMSLGVCIISLLLLLNKQLDEQFKKNLKGIDIVVGAKGSPLQLILASIYQIDSPTGNISLAEANNILHNPMVKNAIPLSMGDSYKSFRIVGTNQKYLQHFEGKLSIGNIFVHPLEVVLGAKVAQQTGLKIGDTFAGTHGFDDNGDVHGDKKYKVVGIAAWNNSVIDNVIITPLESIWAIHDAPHPPEGEHYHLEDEEHHHHEAETPPLGAGGRQITALLVKFKSPMGLMMIPRQINTNTKMQAAAPAIEINRLFDLLGIGFDTLEYIALAIIIISGMSVFVSLYNSLKERKYELALMLSMGATRIQLFLLLVFEGLMIVLLGFVIGLMLSRVGLWLMGQGMESDFHYSLQIGSLLKEEWFMLAGSLLIGMIAAGLPSLTIYRINISETLASE
jgi:putative ABC transport system permease protein